MTVRLYPLFALALLLSGLSPWYFSTSSSAAEADAQELAFFETRIRPLLAEHCFECHGAGTQESGLRLDTYAGIMQGGDSGPAVVPGRPEESLLVAAVGYANEELQMPPDERLSAVQVADLRRWIEMGARHPAATTAALPARRETDIESARQSWTYRSPAPCDLPAVRASDWPQSPLDFFIVAGLEARGLAPAPPAGKSIWLRRVTFDLTGLPPTPEELAGFLADPSPAAAARVVDRLLHSPRYGERWARRWLDVARYADSNGLDENVAHGSAWRYRDYVIAALNKDKPYDQFLTEQVAGDLLPFDSEAVRHEQLIATGFLSLGPKVLAEGDEQKLEMDIIDEQLSTLCQSVLGLTVGCARCHDHKFDPITQEDYYALAGIFKSTQTMESLKRIARWNENEVATESERARQQAHAEQVAAAKQQLQSVLAAARQELAGQLPAGQSVPEPFEEHVPQAVREDLARMRQRIDELEKSAPALPTAMGVREGEATDVRVHLRGNHLTQGKQVARGIPQVLQFDGPLSIPESHSGRLALAHWLVRPEHPLTARVFVNRVWRWYFGRGLVTSVDNFGALGEQPVNPELLDWLAQDLVAHDWSLKHLQRRIVLSATYGMSSRFDAASAERDPQNEYLWRAPVRRLEAEQVRDALLFVAGRLDERMGGSALQVANRAFIFDHTSKDETTYDQQRRSVYLPVVRNHLYDVFSLFDYADASVPNGDRPTSTIAPQALFMMNSDLVTRTAEHLAARVCLTAGDDTAAIEQLYLRLFSRPAGEEDLQRARQYLEAFRQRLSSEGVAAPSDEAWVALCHMLLASNEFIYLR